ncbi:hypothetical protein DFH28DRAFT_1130715 [Melampsora americana]|nr:hypothetical protein DFH28DRAFT_1130715 [Melampsora americana]
MKSPASMTAICLLSLTSLPLIDCMKVLHHLQMNDHVNQIPNSIHNQVFQEPYPLKGEHAVDSLEPFYNNRILATTSNHQVQHHQNPSLDNTISQGEILSKSMISKKVLKSQTGSSIQGIEYNIEPSSSPIELEEIHNHQTSDDENHFNIDNLDLDSTNHHEFHNNGNHGLNLPTSTGYHPDSHEQAGLYYPWSGIIPRFDHQEHIDNHVHLDPHGNHMSSAYHDSRYPVMNNPAHSNFQPIIDLEHESNHVPDQEKLLPKHSNSWALGNQYDDLQHDLVLTDTQILQPPIAHPYSSPPLENPHQGFIDPEHPNTNFNFEDVLEYVTFEDIIPSNDESESYEGNKF